MDRILKQPEICKSSSKWGWQNRKQIQIANYLPWSKHLQGCGSEQDGVSTPCPSLPLNECRNSTLTSAVTPDLNQQSLKLTRGHQHRREGARRSLLALPEGCKGKYVSPYQKSTGSTPALFFIIFCHLLHPSAHGVLWRWNGKWQQVTVGAYNSEKNLPPQSEELGPKWQ